MARSGLITRRAAGRGGGREAALPQLTESRTAAPRSPATRASSATICAAGGTPQPQFGATAAGPRSGAAPRRLHGGHVAGPARPGRRVETGPVGLRPAQLEGPADRRRAARHRACARAGGQPQVRHRVRRDGESAGHRRWQPARLPVRLDVQDVHHDRGAAGRDAAGHRLRRAREAAHRMARHRAGQLRRQVLPGQRQPGLDGRLPHHVERVRAIGEHVLRAPRGAGRAGRGGGRRAQPRDQLQRARRRPDGRHRGGLVGLVHPRRRRHHTRSNWPPRTRRSPPAGRTARRCR